MRMFSKFWGSILGLLLLISAPIRAYADGRIRTLAYDEHEVFRLEACPNFQTMISFGQNEHVENAGLGDASAWQVLPNKRGDLVFVKPLVPKSFSNMTIVTDKHTYEFELRTASEAECRRGLVIYHLSFSYPSPPSVVPTKPKAQDLIPERHNIAYTYSGARELVPFRIFDDGKSTYLKFNDQVSTPAIYVIGADNTESLINYATQGDYFVLDQVARALVLRRGNLVTTIYNEGYVVQGLDTESPQLRQTDGFLFRAKKPKQTNLPAKSQSGGG